MQKQNGHKYISDKEYIQAVQVIINENVNSEMNEHDFDVALSTLVRMESLLFFRKNTRKIGD